MALSDGGVVVSTTVTAGAGTPAAVGLAVDLPAGALARADETSLSGSGGEKTTGWAGPRPGPGAGLSKLKSGSQPASGLGSGWAAHESTPLSWGAMEETQSLKIARSLVEGAGGIFHVLPSLPPTVGRIEMWLPAAAAAKEEDSAEEASVDKKMSDDDNLVDDAVDV